MAEPERESILQRQREGRSIARQECRYQGKQKKEIDKDLFAGVVKPQRAGEITAAEAMKRRT